MSTFGFPHALGAAAAAGAALLAIAAPVHAAPATSTPTADGQGYVDSTARCAAPDSVVIFGSTKSSRVAICAESGGGYEYRGVRVRDGARLVLPAKASGGGYVAAQDGATYTVTASSLVVNVDGDVIRRETWLDVHQPGASGTAPSSTTAPATTTTPTTAKPTTTATTTTTPTTTTPTTPLPPPLPAEAGAGSG